MVRGRTFLAAVPVVGLVACANIWGFNNLELSEGGSSDATTPDVFSGQMPDTSVPGAETSTDDSAPGDDSLATGENDGVAPDAAEPQDAAVDVTEAGSTPDASDAGAGTKVDASDGASGVTCASICAGCCDSQGHCQLGNATGVCGVGGAMCQSCAGQSCTLANPCCKSNGGCGCELLTGAFGCN